MFFLLDRSFAEAPLQETFGKSICPKGSLYTRYFVKADYWKTQVDTPFAEIDLSIAKIAQDSYDDFKVRLTGWPIKLWINFVEIMEFPDLQKGHAFDFRITCGTNTFDFYIDDVKVHSVSDIHSDPQYDPLMVTSMDVKEFSGSICTDIHQTYCM